jgi:hypothetical protein
MNLKIKYKNNTFLILLLISPIIILFFSKAFKYGISPYPMGELLINYKFGFIRRGLIGEVVRISNILFNINQIYSLTIFTSIIYVLVFGYIGFIIRKNIVLLIMMFFSPFGFLFYLNDWRSFGYKDIYVLLFFILGLQYIHKLNEIKNNKGIFIVLLLGILTHENFIVISFPFLLFYLYFLWSKRGQEKEKIISFLKEYSFLIIFFSISIFFTYIFSSFNLQYKIQNLKFEYEKLLIKYREINLIGIKNSLDWLDKSLFYGFKFVYARNFNNLILMRFFQDFIILLISIFLICYSFLNFKTIFILFKKYLIFFIVFLFCFSFLILFTFDWGRWLHLFYMHFFILFIFVIKKFNFNIKLSFKKTNLIFIVIISFFFIVRIPHYYSLNNLKVKAPHVIFLKKIIED